MAYQLQVLDPTGKVLIKTFTTTEYGIEDGIIATADAYSGCLDLDLYGRPDFIPIYGGEVIRAFIVGQSGIKGVFYGAATEADPGKPAITTKPYKINARTLLLGSACPPLRYRNTDTAVIALDVATRCAHPALQVRVQDFPPSGTVLETFNTWDTDGSLAAILDALVTATENAAYGSGIDPTGRVFFRPNTTVLELPYDAEAYNDLPSIATAITTSIRWTLKDEPSITPWGGSYRPVPFTYVSTPDDDAHDRYRYTRSRDLPSYALVEGYNTAYTSSNFSNPAGAVTKGASPAVRTAGTTGTYTLTNDEPLVMGVSITYQTSEDAGMVRFRASCGVTYDVELPNTKGEIQNIPLKLTPHEGGFTKWNTFRITAASGGTMSLLGFYPLQVNTSLLDATAPLVLPEQRPGQAVVNGIGVLAASVKHIGTPTGDRELPVAGVTYTANNRETATTVYEFGQSALEADASGKNIKVRGYYRS